MKTRFTTKTPGSRLAPREQKRRKAASAPRALPSVRTQRILVPVDFSPESTNALKYAAALIGQHQAVLTLLHVVEPIHYIHDFGYGPVKRQRPNISAVKQAEARLRTFGRRHLTSDDPSWGIMVRSGPVCEEIAKAARELEITLIVLPTRGQAPSASAPAETMVARVIRKAACPVLTLKYPLRHRRSGGTQTAR
jgi:nucleotide-binding universal stress UspA family protein